MQLMGLVEPRSRAPLTLAAASRPPRASVLVALRFVYLASRYSQGPDTKLMQNSGRTKFKRTSIDRLMNTLVLWVSLRLPPQPSLTRPSALGSFSSQE